MNPILLLMLLGGGYAVYRLTRDGDDTPDAPADPGVIDVPTPDPPPLPPEPDTPEVITGESPYAKGQVSQDDQGRWWSWVSYVWGESQGDPHAAKKEALDDMRLELIAWGGPRDDDDIFIDRLQYGKRRGVILQSVTDGWYYGAWRSDTGSGWVMPAKDPWGEAQAREALNRKLRQT